MMLGEKIPAEEAERIGMVYKIFPDEVFAENAMSIASYLSQMPTKGLAYTKQLLTHSSHSTLEEQLQDEDIYQQRAAGTKDFEEGVKAFLEKRIPKFIGE